MKKLIMPLLLCSGFFVNAQQVGSASPALYAVNSNTSVNADSKPAADVSKDQPEDGAATKTFSRTYPVDQSDKISVNNQYGSVTIKTWDKKEVKAEINIRAFSSKDAQQLLDQVSIEASKTGDVVTFKTRIEDEKSNWGIFIRNGTRSRREIKVDYILYMPATNALTVSQQYGNVTMGDFNGALSAKVQYGNFVAGKLSSSNNYISVQYGKTNIAEASRATIKHQYGAGVVLGTIGSLNLDAQYTQVDITSVTNDLVVSQQYGNGLTIGSVGSLNLDAQYIKVKIGSVKRNGAIINQQYGNLDITSVGSIKVDAQYTTVNIGQLNGDASFDMQYNSLSIGSITEGVKRLTADCQYVGMSFNFSDRYNANVDVHTNYAGFKFGPGVSAKLTGDDDDRGSRERNYIGKIGIGGTNVVRIKAEYGSVTFK